MTKYIERYRNKYPDDNCIQDDEIVNTASYAFFAFRCAHNDLIDSLVNGFIAIGKAFGAFFIRFKKWPY